MSITLAMIIAFIASNTPSWLAILRTTVLDASGKAAAETSEGLVVSKGGGLIRRVLHLDEKEQIRHLEQALKNATERGLANFTNHIEQDQYKYILYTLMQIGPHSEKLRREALHLFTLSDAPDFTSLNDIYNLIQQDSALNHREVCTDITITPYLTSFFNALIAELYADPYFKPQMRDTLQLRATLNMQQALFDVVILLQNIGETLEHTYTPEHLLQDIENYTAYLQRTLHHLKIVGMVPKDKGRDPELKGIFVPLRIALQDQDHPHDQQPDSLVDTLEAFPYLVLLGGPGSGKSTAIRYLAWSHADAHQAALPIPHQPILLGGPLPLLIELRRLSEARRQANYDFLSFVTEVILRREGIEISQQMFKELLKRRAMLLLFDGLDEVTTPDERIELVQEIEHFTLSYPGNRVIVTSRPVGYDLARLSGQLFSHAEVQPFNNDQIHQFLLNWYSAVLGLSPIPQTDQQELDLLCQTLQDNTRLHKLAENPLLLTVITALHRYERLPDRRVLIYDRCADLLLETWAKIKGTHIRWKDMKMVKDDQYACVAHLGFVLHEQSQKESQGQNKEGAEEITSDVTARILLQEAERFLKSRNLIAEVAQQRSEAKLFIELMKVEAGLIVERGTEANGEPLYGFVHRTFQEYFAAVDVYERYQQEDVGLSVVSDFLMEHLHDPHWREVILLLLGKLRPKPVTKLLSQILVGDLKSRRSQETALLQQDLFFVCDCLVEEIAIETNLIALIISRLSDIIKGPVFPSQRQEAVNYLGALIQTRQYSNQSDHALIDLAIAKDLDLLTRLDILQCLYTSSPKGSEKRQFVTEMLTNLLQHPGFSVEQISQIVESSDAPFPTDPVRDKFAAEIFSKLLQRSDLSVEQIHKIAESLYVNSPKDSEERQLAAKTLANLLQHPDLSFEQIRKTAESLYWRSPKNTEERQLAAKTLTNLLQHPDLSFEQIRKTAESLYVNSPKDSEEKQLAAKTLTNLLQHPDLSFEQIHQTAESLYWRSPKNSEESQFAAEILTNLLQHNDLSSDQVRKTAEFLYHSSPQDSEKMQFATQTLTNLLKRPDLSSVEQIWQTATSLYRSSSRGSQEMQFATQTLTNLLKCPDLSIEQIWQTAKSLYHSSPQDSERMQFTTEMLTNLLKRPDLSIEQTHQTAEYLHWISPQNSEQKQLATEMLTNLLKRPDLSIEQTWQTATSLYLSNPMGSEPREFATEVLTKLFEHLDLFVEQIWQIAESLLHSFDSMDSEQEQFVIAMLTKLLKHPNLSVEQVRQTAECLYWTSSQDSEQNHFATERLLSLVQKVPLTKDWDEAYAILRRMVPQFTKLSSLSGS